MPFISAACQSRLPSLAPPLVDFSGERNPDLPLGTQPGEMVEQHLVRVPRALLMDVVGMDVKSDQAMFLGDESDLSFLQLDRIIVQNMEERVVLCRGQR